MVFGSLSDEKYHSEECGSIRTEESDEKREDVKEG